jgi:hypothetical protein
MHEHLMHTSLMKTIKLEASSSVQHRMTGMMSRQMASIALGCGYPGILLDAKRRTKCAQKTASSMLKRQRGSMHSCTTCTKFAQKLAFSTLNKQPASMDSCTPNCALHSVQTCAQTASFMLNKQRGSMHSSETCTDIGQPCAKW